jgi:hypothetical protein
VVDCFGTKKNAHVVVCDKCGGKTFMIFFISVPDKRDGMETVHHQHQHVQCILCDSTYCDGLCGRAN